MISERSCNDAENSALHHDILQNIHIGNSYFPCRQHHWL